jgi:pimeloyl-ACP methyl ester carboxylesterase
VIESAGHMPHMESAQAFNGIARQFIEDADRIDEKSR